MRVCTRSRACNEKAILYSRHKRGEAKPILWLNTTLEAWHFLPGLLLHYHAVASRARINGHFVVGRQQQPKLVYAKHVDMKPVIGELLASTAIVCVCFPPSKLRLVGNKSTL